MKSKYLLLIPTLLLVGCNQSVNTDNLKIVCPTGAPAFAFYKEAGNSNFETNSTPSNIVAMLSNASDKDVVVIDTVSGIKAINNGAPYKLAATITFGNFFIASTGNDTDNTMDVDDKIVLFGQNQTPDYIFHYLYGNTYDSAIEYVTNVQDAAKCLISGKNAVTTSTVDYVFVAQPILYNALKKNAKASKFIDIQDAYQTKSNGKSLIQASVFIKNTVEKKVSDAFLKELNSNISDAIKNPDVITDSLKEYSADELTALYGVDPSIAVEVIKDNNSLGLGYKNAKENKDAIDAFINLFSLNSTDEKIYY